MGSVIHGLDRVMQSMDLEKVDSRMTQLAVRLVATLVCSLLDFCRNGEI